MINIQDQADQALNEGYVCVTGGLIVNESGQIFVQKRSAGRRLHPNCWDIIGGHAEDGETIQDALSREITEETGWRFKNILEFVGTYIWESTGQKYKEFVFLIKVEGDLNKPVLELNKVSEGRWITKDDILVLTENRQPEDRFIHDVVKAGFKKLETCKASDLV